MRHDHLQLHLENEATNWWFVARERILCDLIEREILTDSAAAGSQDGSAVDSGSGRRFVDIGCGGGGFVETLKRYGFAIGVDASPEAVDFARRRGVDVRQGRLPDQVQLADESFAVVTMLDVVEHIDDEQATLGTAFRLLHPGGHLMITVPAYDFLWSYHDTINGHKRRYTRNRLRQVLEESGLMVKKISYFNTILFPPIAAIRLLRRFVGDGAQADSPLVPRLANRLLTGLFAAERWVLRWGSLPFGVSIVAVARKPLAPDGAGPIVAEAASHA